MCLTVMGLGITTFASEKISTRGAPVEASDVWSYGGVDMSNGQRVNNFHIRIRPSAIAYYTN